METTSLIIGLVLGAFIGYILAKVRITKRIAELKSALENERSLHEQTHKRANDTQHAFDIANANLQREQQEKVKYETQHNESEKHLKSYNEEIKKLKEQHAVLNQNIVDAASQKVKAETELQETRNSIEELIKNNNKYKSDVTSLQEQLTETKTKNADLSAKYQESIKAIEEQKKFVTDANTSLREAFNSLSSEALKSNNQSFLDLAKTALERHITDSRTDLEKRQQAIDAMIKPLNDSLTKFDGKIQEIEVARQGAYSEIKVFLDGVKGTTEKLQKETNTLVTALKTSHIRGRYGEIALKRIVEFAGMSEFCDFEEQTTVTTEDGRLRPDLIVNLPGQRRIIVDAKVPLASYIQAFETTDDKEKANFLSSHAVAVKAHLKDLGSKAYWNQFNDAPDFVIMYLHIESSFGAALEVDRTLIEEGINNKVIIATPTTLITMLKTIAFSWQQEKVAENIYHMRDAGIELYNRVTTLIQHIAAVGNNLNSATQNYNKAVGSLESRFIPQVRRLKDIGGILMDKDIPDLNPIETAIRPLAEIPIISDNSKE